MTGVATQPFEFTPNGAAFATVDPRSDLVLTAPRTPLASAINSNSSSSSTKRSSTSARPPAKKARMPTPTAKHRPAKSKCSKPSKQTSCDGCRRVKTKCDKTPRCRACKLRDEPCIWTGGASPTAPAEPDDVLDVCPRASKEILRLRALVASLAQRLGPGALDFSEDEEDCEDGSSSIATSLSARSSFAALSPAASGPLTLPNGPEFSASTPSPPKSTHEQPTLTPPFLTSLSANFAPTPGPFSFAIAPASQATSSFGVYRTHYPVNSPTYSNYALGYNSYPSSTAPAVVTPVEQFVQPSTLQPPASATTGFGKAYYPEVLSNLNSGWVGGNLQQSWAIPSGY